MQLLNILVTCPFASSFLSYIDPDVGLPSGTRKTEENYSGSQLQLSFLMRRERQREARESKGENIKMDRSKGGGDRKGGGGGGGNRLGEGRSQQNIPFELDEEEEFFCLNPSEASYSWINDTGTPLHSNWLHVVLCNILLNEEGKSFGFETILRELTKRGIDTTEAITKEKLAGFLRHEYYIKYEVLSNAQITDCRFSLNHMCRHPWGFLADLTNSGTFAEADRLFAPLYVSPQHLLNSILYALSIFCVTSLSPPLLNTLVACVRMPWFSS
jgi:hypothetical protein